MKVLFVVPSLKLIGGVANHYLGLNDYWKSNFRYSYQGHREHIPAWIMLIPDYFKFFFQLIFFSPKIVVINPSLGWYMVIRDALYLLLAKMFNKKVVCFFHGWELDYAQKVEQHPYWFKKVYQKADLIYVLFSEYKNQLERMGFTQVKLNTTKVDDKLLKDFHPEERNRNITNILFLARVAKDKGIYVALDAFFLLKKKFPELKFTVVGNGCDYKNAQNYAKNNKIPDVYFTGGLKGEDLSLEFRKGDIYILPTYYEGMATSILEAMAFGLPIISTPVGGVVDFFVNDEMGYLLNSHNPSDYAEAITKIIMNKDLYKKMVHNNYDFAQEHFLASMIASRMENDFQNLLVK